MADSDHMKKHVNQSVPAQTILDCGLNVFALQLLLESYTKHPDPKPVTIPFKGVNVSLSMCDQKPKEAILLHSKDGDWEGLFIGGALISEGHQLGEGRKEYFWLNVGAKYGITGDDLVVREVSDADDEQLCASGNFPILLSEMKGQYGSK